LSYVPLVLFVIKDYFRLLVCSS